MKKLWIGDSGRTVTLPSKYPAHNPNGLGWKKHGKDGRFTTKPKDVNFDRALIGFLFCLDVYLTGIILHWWHI